MSIISNSDRMIRRLDTIRLDTINETDLSIFTVKLKRFIECTDDEEFISVCSQCGGAITYPSFEHYKLKAFGLQSWANHDCDVKEFNGKGAPDLNCYDDYYGGYGYYDYSRYVYDHVINN